MVGIGCERQYSQVAYVFVAVFRNHKVVNHAGAVVLNSGKVPKCVA